MTDKRPPAQAERLHALGLVRASALLLGSVFHAALPFIPDYEAWLVMDDIRSRPVAGLAFWLHSFRMPTFFLLAGFFGHMMLGRRGTAGFVRDRARRTLAPLLIFWPPVMSLFALTMPLAAASGAVPVPAEPAPLPQRTTEAGPMPHPRLLYAQ